MKVRKSRINTSSYVNYVSSCMIHKHYPNSGSPKMTPRTRSVTIGGTLDLTNIKDAEDNAHYILYQ